MVLVYSPVEKDKGSDFLGGSSGPENEESKLLVIPHANCIGPWWGSRCGGVQTAK